jgi:hypothetical protein
MNQTMILTGWYVILATFRPYHSGNAAVLQGTIERARDVRPFDPLAQWQSIGLLIRRFRVRAPGGSPAPYPHGFKANRRNRPGVSRVDCSPYPFVYPMQPRIVVPGFASRPLHRSFLSSQDDRRELDGDATNCSISVHWCVVRKKRQIRKNCRAPPGLLLLTDKNTPHRERTGRGDGTH